MIDLGISFSHDGTLTVFKDGIRIWSSGEERYNRIKAYIGFPFMALRSAIESGVFSPQDVRTVSVPLGQYHAKAAWIYAFILTEDKCYYDIQNDVRPSDYFVSDLSYLEVKTDQDAFNYVKAKLRSLLSDVGIDAELYFCDHHESHAASAYFASGFSDALIVTMDGEGDGLSASISTASNGEISKISTTSNVNSVGYLYSAVTTSCGFKMSRHEGKITGLAAYGSSKVGYPIIDKHLKVKSGKFYYEGVRSKSIVNRLIARALSYFNVKYPFGPSFLIDKISNLSDQDRSASVQDFLEDKIKEVVQYWMENTGCRNVVLAGGLFANVKFNQRISEIPILENLFIYPDMGDGGTAYGAACITLNRLSRLEPSVRLDNVYLGDSFSNEEILAALSQSNEFEYMHQSDISKYAADLLSSGQIVGWFQGGMEYGPRALGNRSILASAHDREINTWLNERMKRTEFMPFAPSCLVEYADDVFEITNEALKYPAEFMTLTFRMKNKWIDLAPAVAHVDGTARPQLVSSTSNPRYHALLSRYLEVTGVPLVVNTSFNVHEEPIVRTPAHALNALRGGVIDALCIGDYAVTLKNSSPN